MADKNARAPLVILHFNDVYEIEPREQEPKGGAARFVSLVRGMEAEKPLVLFSGDVFAPSILSTVTRGKHMVPILNLLNIGAAVYGNHDFDHGVPRLEDLASKCNFPWLISNVWDRTTGGTLGNGHEWLVLEWQGYRIGLMGLIESEWLETLATVSTDHIRYESFVDVGRKLARLLRTEQKVDFVIALTHMRVPNDELLAKSVPELDLILGGHDHDYFRAQHGRVNIVKSGCDFRDASRIVLSINTNAEQPSMEDGLPLLNVAIDRLAAVGSIPEDPETAEIVRSFAAVQQKQLSKVIAKVGVALDARFAFIRTQETNIANWIADIMANEFQVDVALLNAGSLRADELIPVGEFRLRDLVKLLPMNDDLVIIKVTGTQLLAALENGVSQYPKKEGRFPCVSGVQFSFDPRLPEFHRVIEGSVRVKGEPLELAKIYRLVTKLYIKVGRDGYGCLDSGEVVTTPEELPALPDLVRNHLTLMNVAKNLVTKDMVVNEAASRFLHKRHRKQDWNGYDGSPVTSPLSAPSSAESDSSASNSTLTSPINKNLSIAFSSPMPSSRSFSADGPGVFLSSAAAKVPKTPTPVQRSMSSSAELPTLIDRITGPRPTIVCTSPTSASKRRQFSSGDHPGHESGGIMDLLVINTVVDGRIHNVCPVELQ